MFCHYLKLQGMLRDEHEQDRSFDTFLRIIPTFNKFHFRNLLQLMWFVHLITFNMSLSTLHTHWAEIKLLVFWEWDHGYPYSVGTLMGY